MSVSDKHSDALVYVDVAEERRLKSIEGMGGRRELARLVLLLLEDESKSNFAAVAVEVEEEKKLPRIIFEKPLTTGEMRL